MQQFFHKEIKLSEPALYWLENEACYTLSYLELGQAIEQRVVFFKEIIQIKKGDIVAVLAHRGPEYVINLFALWYLEAVYLPLSNTYTIDSLVQRLEKSDAHCLLTVKSCYQQWSLELKAWAERTKKSFYCLDDDSSQSTPSQFPSKSFLSVLDFKNNLDDIQIPGCIFSSSGTSGEPKLIEIPLNSFSDRVKTEIIAWNMPNKVGQAGVLGFIDFGFDASVNEILLATMTGNALYIVPENIRKSHQGIPHFLKRFDGKIRAAILLPSVLKGLYPEDCRDLIYLLTMGEKCLLDDLKAKRWFDVATILNGYGPTETTFGASVTLLSKENLEPGIQDPMIGLTLYLMETLEIDFCDNQVLALECAKHQPNVFLLYAADKEQWCFYLSDYSDKIYQGSLSSDKNTLCEFLRNPNASVHNKINFHAYVARSKQELLNVLLEKSIRYPRYIVKFKYDRECELNPYFSRLVNAKNLSSSIQGEIYIGGKGIGRYLNNEQKNKEKFLNPEEAEKWGLEKERIFKSGDIAEYHQSSLIYRNRNDRQIKRYGVLVTLDDIEDLLRKYLPIDNVAVIYHESAISDPVIIAFLVPTNLTLSNAYSDLSNEAQKILKLLEDPGKIESKHRPNCCFFVDKIPITQQRNKVSYQLEDYAVCHPVRLIEQDNLESSQENEILSKISNIWQNLLEGNLSQLLRLEDKNKILYPLDCTFTELGGDSLLMSLMTQKIWELHSGMRTPAPNDFSHAIVHNSTLSGIQHILMFYGYQAIEKRNTQTQGLPVFIFEGVPELGGYPFYQFCLPKDSAEQHRKIFVTILKNQCRQIQAMGSYHLISTNQHLELALLLAKELATVSDSTYLTILQDETLELPDVLQHSIVNLCIDCVNTNTLFGYIHQCHHARLQMLVRQSLEYLFDEYIKDTSFLLTQVAGGGWLTRTTSGHTCWLLGMAGCGKTTTLRHLIKHEGVRGQVLPLKVHGLKQAPLFETALSLIFPRWQWHVLAEQALVIVIDDYDALARLDCPNLWQQAYNVGFSNVRWLISCRFTYWNIYQNVIHQFASDLSTWQSYTVAFPLPLKASELILQTSLPMTLAAYEIVQRLKEKYSHNSESVEFRYLCLKAWFKREYARQVPGMRKSDYLYQVFETLSLLYDYYGKERHHIYFDLQKSHWQSQSKLPCIHALPHLNAVLSLFACDRQTSIQLPLVLRQEAHEYLKLRRKSQTKAHVQSFTNTDIRVLQAQWSEHFWEKLNSNHARYHVLPLQYASNSIPIFIFHPMTGETPVSYRRLAEALGPHQTVIALQMWVGDKHKTSEEKARIYYDYILRLQAKGPYVLIGWSFGAIVAYHVAILLETNDYQVDWVINLDSAPPEYFSHQDLDARVLDMIHTLAHTAYKVPLDEAVLRTSVLDELSELTRAEMYFEKAVMYVKSQKNAEQYKNFCHAMEKASVNLRVYLDFARWCHKAKPILKAKYWVFEAVQSNAGRLNGVDFAQWASYCGEGLFYHDKINADHFSLFDIDLFQHLRTRLYRYQGIVLSLSGRLAQYREKRLQLFEEEKKLPVKGIYISAIASEDQEGLNTFSLEEQAIVAFLNNKGLPRGANCFLIQGDPGSGKSHYQKQLEYTLFKSAQYFPLLISLKPGCKDNLKSALLAAGFTEEEYQATKQQLQENHHQKKIIHNIFGSPLLVIFDGYDEALTKDNLYRLEQLELWQAKALISCRTYAVNWLTMREQFGDTEGRIQTAYLQPFREEDIKKYLKLYEHQTGQVLIFTSYEEIPNLIQNPLLLSIAVELWTKLSNYRNRAELYHDFFQKLYQKDQEKIHSNEGIRSLVSLNEAFVGYNQYQAYQYWRYSVTQDPTSLKLLESIPNNYDTYQARQGSRLGIHEDGRLTHITFWEYYFASFIVKAVLVHNFSELDTAYPTLLGEASIAENVSLLTFIGEVAQVLPWMQFDCFRHHLFLTVYASRYKHLDQAIDSAKVIAATNAISILTVMQVSFSGLNLRGIRVPGAYLKRAIFDTTCLRGADLRGARMHDVVLRYADLREADLCDVDFGQLPKLVCVGKIDHLCFNPCDKNQLAVGVGNTIEIWNIKYRKLLWSFKGQACMVNCIDYSRNGDILVSGSEDHTIRIWDLKTGLQKAERQGHTKEIRCVAFNPTSQNFISGDDDGILYIWTLSKETPLKEVILSSNDSFNELHILSAAYSSDGKTLALGCSNHSIWLLNAEQYTPQLKLNLPTVWSWAECILFSSDNKNIIVSGGDSICIWNLESKQNKILKGPQDGVSKLVNSRSGLVTSGYDEICIWDIERDIQRLKLRGTIQNISSLACCPEGKLLASASHAGEVHFWNIDQLIEKEKRKGHKGGVIAIAFSPDGQNLASSGDDKKIRVWDLGKNIQKTILKGHSDRVTDLCYSFNGCELASCSGSGTILIWDVVRGVQKAKLMPQLPFGGMWHIAYSRCGNYIFSGDPKGKICKWDIAAGRHIVELLGHTKQINKLACSSDEKILISASDDKTIRIWDIEHNTQKAILQGHTDDINSFAYSLDETSLLSGGMDQKLRFWNINQGAQIAKLKGNVKQIYSLAYVPPSGNSLAESGGDTICLWDLNNRQLTSKLQSGYSVGNLDFNCFGVLAVSGSCKWTGPFCGRDTVIQWSPVPNSPWSHYQIISVYSKTPALNIEHLLLENTILSRENKYLLEGNKSTLAKLIWPEPEILKQVFKNILNCIDDISLFGLPRDIFHNHIINQSPQSIWNVFACINRQYYNYFGLLKNLAETLVAQAMPIPHHYSQQWIFEKKGDGLEFEFVDAYNIKHRLWWPAWFIENLIPLRLKTHVTDKINKLKNEENQIFCFIFKESTTRRLVYQLSLTYLLSTTLCIVLDLGLNYCIRDKPISLYHIFDLVFNARTEYKKNYLKRIIEFLSDYGLLVYDKENEMISWSDLGLGIISFSQENDTEGLTLFNLRNEEKTRGTKIKLQSNETSFLIKSSPIGIVSTLIHMKALSKTLSNAASLKLFDAIAKGSNTRQALLENYPKLINVLDDYLRTLQQYHFLGYCEKTNSYHLTVLSEYLRSDHPETLQPTIAMLDNIWWKVISMKFYRALIYGDNHSDFIHICNADLSRSHENTAKFNKGISCLKYNQNKMISTQLSHAVCEIINYNSVVDIAGGEGQFLKIIQKQYPNFNHITLYEQTSVVSKIQSKGDGNEIKNLELISGNFFDPPHNNKIPKNRELYFIKDTLHDFDDSECLKILNHIRAAIPNKSKLCVIERTLYSTEKPTINDYADLLKMMLFIGRERYAHEWLFLFYQAGFLWENEKNPIVVEDHTIMVCKPTYPEIPRFIGFFANKKSFQQSNSVDSILHLIDQREDALVNIGRDTFISRKNIIDNFKLIGSYSYDYLSLLCLAINPDPQNWFTHSAVKSSELHSVNVRNISDTFSFLLLPIFLEENHAADLGNESNGHWVGFLIDYFRRIIFYLDPLQKPIPNGVYNTFIQSNEQLIKLPIVQNLSKKILNIQPENSGVYLVTIMSKIIQEIQANNHITENPVHIFENIEHIMMMDVENHLINLKQQHLRWATNHLVEVNLEKQSTCLMIR